MSDTPRSAPDEARRQAAPALAQTVALIIALRTQAPPAPWPAVYAALGLSAREVKLYRWLIAAELYAVNGSWTATAKHPAVNLNVDTVRKDHPRAKLPGGLTWDGYIADYQHAYQTRLSEIQQARGEQDAETIAALGRRSLDVLGRLQTRIEQCVDDPPEIIAVSAMFFIPGKQTRQAQQKLDFASALGEAAGAPVPTPADKSTEPLLSIEAARYLLGAQQEVLAGLEKASRLLTSLPPADSEDAGETAAPTAQTAEEIELLIQRVTGKAAELAGYTRKAA